MFREAPKIIIDDVQAPSASFTVNILMEDLMEKLKILDYDNDFVQELKMKPINRHYFLVPKNPGEQFFCFTSLAAWLIRKSGKKFEQPQESDDPNSTISSILDYLRSSGTLIEFPPNKLKQGVGEHAIYVLDCLADQAIKASNFKWQKPEITVNDSNEESEIEDDDAELVLEKVEEEMMANYDNDDDDNIIHIDDIIKNHSDFVDNIQKADNILESQTDAEEWKIELERVIPQLKVTIKTDSRDWRAHIEQMKQHQGNISKDFDNTKNQLEKLHNDIDITLEKIHAREIYLNKQLEPSLIEYRSLQEELSKVREKYRDVSGGVTERTRTLNKLTEELEQIKKEMDERGSSMTDGTPLINIKKNITKIKSEISDMSVRIGVLEYSLMCARIRDRTQLQEDMNNTNLIK
ncbi:intraflagellar transport protein 57 homolog [Aphidius gifuensis]|uniref:intraflagellar transport protein 57 homolog n=1 Tax=Aphidius gifuensis TaxID=684658 RepID=UPI001CDD18EE|nr:intraflagellar transport protein 57 homolog [Aphidius gifuensis]